MPSTYTTSLKIQQIGNGEQSGVWGNTTNSNWNLIEQAVAGVTTITMENADYTLSNLNGVPDEARNMVLKVQGINSGVRKVIAPLNQPKIYIISNETTGGYDITIGSATGSFITIPNGVTAQVYTDGTNFFSSQTGSAGDFYVNGNATVEGNLTLGGTLNYVPAGTINMWPTATAPSGFLLCAGAAVSRTTYAALFAVIGTTFGSGDGSTTFNLPNYTNRMPIGAGSLYSLNSQGGSKDATLVSHNHGGATGGQSATHTHGFSGTTVGMNQARYHSHSLVGIGAAGGNPDARINASTISGEYASTSTVDLEHSHNFSGTTATNSNDHTHTISTQGSSATDANLPPYLGINFIIKT